MTLYELFVKLGADTQDYDRKLTKASNQLRSLGEQFSAVGSRLTAAITLPLAGVAGSALLAAGKIEQTSVAFTTMMKSADEAQKHLAQLKDFAAKTPFQFVELTDASRRMQALGFAARDVVPMLTTIGNAVSALGGGAELLNRVTMALGQMQAKGKVSGEEMKQLAEAGISAWDALAKKLNVDVATAMKLVEARAVDASVGISAVMEAMRSRFAGGMEAQSKTLIGMWSNVKDAIMFTLADIGKALIPVAKDVVANQLQPMLDKAKELADEFSKLSPAAQKAGVAVAALAAAFPPLIWATGATITNATAVSTALVRLSGALGLGQIGTAVYALRNNLVPALTAAESKGLLLGRALTALPWVALAAGIGFALNKLNDTASKTDTTAEAIKRLNKNLAESSGAVSNSKFDTLMDFMRTLPEATTAAADAQGDLAVEIEKVKVGWKSLGDVLSEINAKKAADQLEKDFLDMLRRVGNIPVVDLPTIEIPIRADMFVIPEKVTVDWSKFKAPQPDLTDLKASVNLEVKIDDSLKTAAEEGAKISEAIFGEKPRKAVNEFERETRRAFDHMSRQIAKSIVEWKGFGESLKNVAKSFAEGMLEILIRQFFKPLENLMAKAVASLTGWITGGAGQSASSGVMNAVGTGVSGAGGGGAAGSGGGGASGVLGVVTGAISAVSGVIGNFQMAGMNKSLDLIEHETRYSQIHLLNILEKLNVYIPKLQDIWDYNWNAQFPLLLRMTTALEVGAHGGVTINISGARDARAVAQEVAKELRLRVPAAAFA